MGVGEGSSRVHRVPRTQTLEICSVFPSKFSRKHLMWDWLPEAGYLEWRLGAGEAARLRCGKGRRFWMKALTSKDKESRTP